MAIDEEHLEVASGDVNGVNDTFYTSVPYQSGTLKLWYNGILIRRDDDDGFIETNPATGEFQVKEPPEGGLYPETPVVRYLEA